MKLSSWFRNLFSSEVRFGDVKFGEKLWSNTTSKSMSSITINGKTYVGKSISIINGKVTIDGVAQDGEVKGVVRVEVTGDLASLTTDAPAVVNGNVHQNVEADGPVTCNEVGGSVTADGPVTCGNVQGSVTADGPVTCGHVGGNVKADMVMHS